MFYAIYAHTDTNSALTLLGFIERRVKRYTVENISKSVYGKLKIFLFYHLPYNQKTKPSVYTLGKLNLSN